MSLWKMIRSEVMGFGKRNLGFVRAVSLEFEIRRKQDIRVLLKPRGGTDPSPTMLRPVSGKQMSISIRDKPERILRNPKIHLQPAFSASTPPKTGPRLGAELGLLVHIS